MKYLKTYEDVSTQIEPQPGDYILSNNYTFGKPGSDKWGNYIRSNIGTLIRTDGRVFETKYILTPEIIKDCLSDDHNSIKLVQTDDDGQKFIIMMFERYRITYFSKNKEDILSQIHANKFNL